MTAQEKAKEIKQSFRLYMNGVTADSLRDKGMTYKIAWGVSLQHLQEIAAKYGKDFDLAIELWKSEVRECKLLATMIMPAERMDHELLDVWMESCHTLEVGEMLVFNLLQHTKCAPTVAFEWIATDNELLQTCGFGLMSRLLMKGAIPNDRALEEIKDQAETAMGSQSMAVKHAAMNCLNRLPESSN